MGSDDMPDAVAYGLSAMQVLTQDKLDEMQMKMKQAQYVAQNNTRNAISGTVAGAAWPSVPYSAAALFDPNKEPAYQLDLVALKDLFRAKNGTGWVRIPPVLDDEFWYRGISRLNNADMLERVDSCWYRLREDK